MPKLRPFARISPNFADNRRFTLGAVWDRERVAAIDVRPANRTDLKVLGSVLARAFYHDPVMMWMLPEAERRQRALDRMFVTMARHHFLPGGGSEVALRSGTVGAAALWNPPGGWKQTGLQELLMMPGFVRAFGRRTARGREVAELMKHHHPEEPHWYLGVIGSDPTVRGGGFGHALMRSRLDRVDAEHAPAYLESSNPDNVPYYLRFGFEVTGEIPLPEDGPIMTAMWRRPR